MINTLDSPEPLIFLFYSGRAPDHRGRHLEDYWKFRFEQLEREHDYIQWMFPTWQRSQFHDAAPVLDEAAWQAFNDSLSLRERLSKSLDLMLAFYGLAWAGKNVIEGDAFMERSRNWLTLANHNHLRLTRIMSSLHTLGLHDKAQALGEYLSAAARKFPSIISRETAGFWREAARLKA